MNNYWQIMLRHPGGRPRIAPKTADELWERFVDYVELSASNPIALPQYVNKETGERGERRRGSGGNAERPLSRQGFMVYLGIGYDWTHFRRYYNEKPGYTAVLTRIAEVIECQQLEGALVGTFNANIVARLNGYRDALDHTSDGEKLDLVINLK